LRIDYTLTGHDVRCARQTVLILGSISSTFYAQILRAKNTKVQKYNQAICLFCAFVGVKAVPKMLVKSIEIAKSLTMHD